MAWPSRAALRCAPTDGPARPGPARPGGTQRGVGATAWPGRARAEASRLEPSAAGPSGDAKPPTSDEARPVREGGKEGRKEGKGQKRGEHAGEKEAPSELDAAASRLQCDVQQTRPRHPPPSQVSRGARAGSRPGGEGRIHVTAR